MNAVIKNSGGCGQESILFEDRGEILIIDKKYVVVNSDTNITTEDSVMNEDNLDTLTGTKCDSCIECNCMPCVCRCDCHKPSDMFKMENLEGE